MSHGAGRGQCQMLCDDDDGSVQCYLMHTLMRNELFYFCAWFLSLAVAASSPLGAHPGNSWATEQKEIGGERGDQMEETEEREREGERGGEESDLLRRQSRKVGS